MLNDRSDEFYDARLIATAKMHLTLVMENQEAPLFFEAMNKIIKRKAYLGYKTIRGKEVKLSGMKDFFFNFHYGLGIRNLPVFLANCADIESRDRSKDKQVREFIDWLRQDDPDSFEFPNHYWELRRMRIAISLLRIPREKKRMYWRMLSIIYNTKPEVVEHIGIGRKYKSVIDAYRGEGYIEAPQNLTPIKLYTRPTYKDIERLAVDLNSRLDKLKNRVLIAKLIEIYKINDAIEKYANRSAPPDDCPEI